MYTAIFPARYVQECYYKWCKYIIYGEKGLRIIVYQKFALIKTLLGEIYSGNAITIKDAIYLAFCIKGDTA